MAGAVDKWGIKMIYPTRKGGREYFIRDTVEDLKQDSRQGGDLRDDVSGGNNTDGFTIGDNGQVRLHVGADSTLRDASNPDLDQSTAKGRGYAFTTKDWDMKGIEMTTQFKCTKLLDSESTFIMKGPSGSHRSNTQDCSGSSYLLRFYVPDSGSHASRFEWSKEQWHVKYSTKAHQPTNLPHLFNKWCTGKYIIYLIKSTDGTQQWVKLEAYLDVDGDGIGLRKIGEIVDKGGWGSSAQECGADRKDEIITWDNAHMTLRWNGPVFRFRRFSIREIDPLKTIDAGEPQAPVTTGTLARDFIFKNNIIAFPIDACGGASDTSTVNEFYNVDGGSASNLHKERYRVGVVANGSNSYLIGKVPRRVVLRLSKTGSPPSGNITCVLRKGSDDEVAVTFTYTGGGGNLNATSLTTSKADYTFENLTSNYVWQNGDRINVEYSSNTTDTTNEVNVFRDSDNPLDGNFTCAVKFDTGGVPPTAYSAPDFTVDYAWKISELK